MGQNPKTLLLLTNKLINNNTKKVKKRIKEQETAWIGEGNEDRDRKGVDRRVAPGV